MKWSIKILFIFLFVANIGFAQDVEKQERLANKQLREGNELYQKANYPDAEVSYKKSMATHPGNPKAIYNLANAMMQQKRYKEAIAQYDYLAKNAKSTSLKAQSYHNIGNANMGLNDYQKAVDAYKNSLRKNPKDEETHYNLALAQELLKQQQDQNQDNQDDQNKDDKNQDKKDQDKKDDKEKNEDNKDDEKKDDKSKEDNKDKDEEGDEDKNDKEDPNKDKEEDKDGDQDDEKEKPNEEPKDQKEQPQPGKLSPQQVKQLLEAMQNEEKKTQDKINAKKVKGQPVKTEKDW